MFLAFTLTWHLTVVRNSKLQGIGAAVPGSMRECPGEEAYSMVANKKTDGLSAIKDNDTMFDLSGNEEMSL